MAGLSFTLVCSYLSTKMMLGILQGLRPTVDFNCFCRAEFGRIGDDKLHLEGNFILAFLVSLTL